MGFNLTDFLANSAGFYKSGTALELIGAPGLGKSSAIMQTGPKLARSLGKPFAIVTQLLSTLESPDIRGVGIPMKDGEDAVVRWSKPGVFPTKWNCDVFLPDGTHLKKNSPEARAHIEAHGIPNHGILFLDELGQADHPEQKAASQLILEGIVGDHTLPDNWVVWAASNRMEDRSGVVKPLMMLQNRRKVLNIIPDYEAWQDWAFGANVHPLGIAFAKSNAGDVFRESVPAEPGPFCTPRSLVLCMKDLVALTPDDYGSHRLIDNHIATEVVSGWMGEGVMTKFMTHIRLGNELPDVDEVMKHPTTTKVPSRLDARFVMATSLSVHATTKEKMRPILKYVERMDVELQTLFVSAVVKRFPASITIVEFSEWLKTNQKLVLAAKR